MTGIKYVSFAEPSGYGVAGKRCLLALARAGIPVTWAPMVGGIGTSRYYGSFAGRSIGDADLDPFCNKPIAYDVVIIHTVPEYFPDWIEAERGRTIVGHTVWETTAVPKHWPNLLNAVDHLLVPCHWNKSVFEEGGVTVPIDVVPHVADQDAAAEAVHSERSSGGDYVFYTIGVWNERKALNRTVEAFCEAFTASDPVTLWIKTNATDFTVAGLRRYLRPSVERAVRRITRRYRRPPRIQIMTDVVGDADIRALHRAGDCYVSLCRGEGWGIGAFDAAAHGNPVVMTGFGGQLDFLKPDLAYLVDYALVSVVCRALPSYSPDQRWAEPNVRHGAEQLRQVASHPEAAKARGRALQQDVVARFDDRAVLQRLIPAIARAPERPGAAGRA